MVGRRIVSSKFLQTNHNRFRHGIMGFCAQTSGPRRHPWPEYSRATGHILKKFMIKRTSVYIQIQRTIVPPHIYPHSKKSGPLFRVPFQSRGAEPLISTPQQQSQRRFAHERVPTTTMADQMNLKRIRWRRRRSDCSERKYKNLHRAGH